MIPAFDLEALKRDRDQLWAEAAVREATGVSIRLPRELWPRAAEEQTKRQIQDPFFVTLHTHLGEFQSGKISAEDVWTILDLRAGSRTQEHNRRMGEAMKELGWSRPSNNQVRINGKKVNGYTKGDQPWPALRATRDRIADEAEVFEVRSDNSDNSGATASNRSGQTTLSVFVLRQTEHGGVLVTPDMDRGPEVWLDRTAITMSDPHPTREVAITITLPTQLAHARGLDSKAH